jgi:hypothetical protein
MLTRIRTAAVSEEFSTSGKMPDIPPRRRAAEARDSVHIAEWAKQGAPTLNIDTIAEQVIKQIDNRVIAWRERLGKV